MTTAKDRPRGDVPTTDVELWRRVQVSDGEAFAELYRRHLRAVLGFCLRRTADPDRAEDLAATAFLEVWRQRSRLRLTCETARPLLLGVANNLLRHDWRSRRRHAEALGRLRGAAADRQGAEDDEIVARLDAQAALRQARRQLQTLPRREREVLSLIAWADLTYEEAAAALRIPIGTVRSRLARARKRMEGLASQEQSEGRRPTVSEETATASAKGAAR